MSMPILDPRTKANLMELIRRRASEYTPEWRYEREDTQDPGAAIATLFGEMFLQTIDRYNLLPQKYFTEFLNLMDAASPGVTPACGLVQFEVGGESEPVPIPAGTEIFATDDSDGDQIVYATERKIEATTAQLLDVYYADAKEGTIEQLDLTREQPFFAPAGGENLQSHRFAFSHNEVLALAGPCTVEVSLRQSARFMEEGSAKLLADPQKAVWRYFNGTQYPAFDAVRAEGSVLLLKKSSLDEICAEENGDRYLYCDVHPSVEGSITISGVQLKSALPEGLAPDSLSNNDIPISLAEGGYCFGRRPAPYELFYVRSDHVFCKRGAQIKLQLSIVPVVYSEVGREPQYEFNRRIIDKNDAVRVMPEDVFVAQVVWEYFNGLGWAKLEASGNVNPFSCKGEGESAVLFTVPMDIESVSVNAEEGFFVRARVIHVENFLSTIPRWILPFVKDASCSYQYMGNMPASSICTHNNAAVIEMQDIASVGDLRLAVYEPMIQHHRAMYLRFHASPHAMPLSMLLRVVGEAEPSSKIVYEAWRGGFEPVRMIDGTGNLRYTGTVFLYLSEPLQETEFFGQKGYWLRMSLSSPVKEQWRSPRVEGISFNVVNAVQQQQAAAQAFDTGVYDVRKVVELVEKPVLGCSVWVDEISSVSETQISRLEQELQQDVQVEREGNRSVHCHVLWKRVPTLAHAAPGARVYELDSNDGVIRFGDGMAGMVPPQGDLNIRVEYTYGGGIRGNLPEGRVNALVGSIARVNGISNIVPMSGGTDTPPIRKTEALSNKLIRHRGRAFSDSDFEQMTLLQFERAARVKCFPNTNAQGERAPGHICLVVMGRDFSGEHMAYELCRDIYEYLSVNCDCNLVAGGRLHVVPSTQMTVSTYVLVRLRDLDQAANTQQELTDHITTLIQNQWRTREIGSQINLPELYQIVKATKNVQAVRQILCEGSYYAQGRRLVLALDDGQAFPFATVKSGTHTIRVE